MSLTRFLKIADVRSRFSEAFPMPSVRLDGPELSPPRTDHHGLVGTAFDYLLRFYLERLNPNSVTQPWVAEQSLELIRGNQSMHLLGMAIVRGAKRAKAEYIRTGEVSEMLLESSLLLGQMDGIYRAGVIDPNLGVPDHDDVEDLRSLLSVVKPDSFRAQKICVLNPVFAQENLVGGADADFIIDDTLFEVKTTKFLGLRTDYYHQLIGYYLLFKIGGLLPDRREKVQIRRLAIYYSRHGMTYSIDISSVASSASFDAFLEWFKLRARQEYPQDG